MKRLLVSLTILVSLNIACFAMPVDCVFNPQKRQALDIIYKHNNAIKNRNIDKALTYYDKDYKNSDGYNVDNLKEMVDKTFETFPNIKSKIKINDISIYDDVALVKISDTTKAKVYPYIDENVKKSLAKRIKKEKVGNLTGKSDYLVYLKKVNGSYKIFSDITIMEETALKYGIANKIDMKLDAPIFIKKGQEYEIALRLDKQDDYAIMASINKEEIKYPTVDYPEKYRKFPDVGPLERLVKANKQDLDEYATASVGFTKVTVNNEQTKAKIEILGMAYLMKRVNMEKAAMALIPNKKIKEKEESGKKL